MKAKDLIIDFINLLFLVGLVGLVLLYFMAGDRFNNFVEIMQNLIPVAIFGVMFLVMLKIKRKKIKEKKRNQEDMGIALYLTYFDKLKGEIILYLLPIIILLIGFFVDKIINVVDVIQATVAFLLMYLWQRILFKKGTE